MNGLLSLSSSFNESHLNEEFLAFKIQLNKVQNVIDECNKKIVDKILCLDDLANMKKEMKYLADLERKLTSEKMKSSYVSSKTMSLRLVQESYRICDWLMEKECGEMDNVFDINTFIEKICEKCASKEDPLSHINTLFKNLLKDTNIFNLNFYGNTKPEEISEQTQLVQIKKESRRCQKRQLEDQVVPDEVENETGDNELQITLGRVISSLKRAVSNNNWKPVSFHKFAIDPFSLTFTIENIFHLASLAKDGHIKIERTSDAVDDEFTTITVVQKKNLHNIINKKDNLISSLFTINHDLWKYYVEKYNITERMIEQDE